MWMSLRWNKFFDLIVTLYTRSKCEKNSYKLLYLFDKHVWQKVKNFFEKAKTNTLNC